MPTAEAEMEQAMKDLADMSISAQGEGDRDGGPKKPPLFQPGDVIQEGTPAFIKVLDSTLRGERCHSCFAKKQGASPFFLCTGCRMVNYCGKKCHQKDWKDGHSIECKSDLWKNPITEDNGNPVDPELIYHIFRTLFIIAKKPERMVKMTTLYDGRKICIRDVIDGIVILEEFRKLYGSLSENIVLRLMAENGFFKKLEDQIDAEYILKLMVLWNRCGFHWTVQENDNPDESSSSGNILDAETVGVGLYFVPSIFAFENSCRPNAVRLMVPEKKLMEIRCIAEIHEGEVPTIYCCQDEIWEVGQRQERLEELFSFRCKCQLCEQEMTEGPIVDYELLIRNRNLAISSVLGFGGRALPWKGVYRLHQEALKLFRKVFNEYDSRITNFYTNMYEGILFRYSKHRMTGLSEKVFFELMKDWELRMRITYGIHHPDYKALKSRIHLFNSGVGADRNADVNENDGGGGGDEMALGSVFINPLWEER